GLPPMLPFPISQSDRSARSWLQCGPLPARLGTRRKYGVGAPHAEHGADEECCVHAEADGDGRKETGYADVQQINGDEPNAGTCYHAHRVSVHRHDTAADPLHDEEKPQAEPEAKVGRADDAEIEGAETRDISIVAEQADPQTRLEGDNEADRSAQ